MNWKKIVLFVVLVAVALSGLKLFANYYGDLLWFQNLGFSKIFTTVFTTKLLVFSFFFLVFAITGGTNIYIARRIGSFSRPTEAIPPVSVISILDRLFHHKRAPVIWAIILVAAIVLWKKLLIIAACLLLFIIVSGINIYISKKRIPSSQQPETPTHSFMTRLFEIVFQEKKIIYIWLLILLILSAIMGIKASKAWMTYLKFIHPSQFGVTDPIFSKDAGFYVFVLPFYYVLNQWCSLALFFIISAIVISYYTNHAIGIKKSRFYVSSRVKIHLSIMGGLVALVLAWSYRLKMYGLMYSSRGVVRGAGYADVHAQLPAFWLLMIICIIIALLLFVMPAIKKWRWSAYAFALYLVVLLVCSLIYPRMIQQYVVKPNELAKETSYIENNIKFTRLGFGLDKAREEVFPAEESVSYDDIKTNDATIHNIRLWDHRPLLQTYKQLQEIRLYYNFKSVDMDRYYLQNKYTEVALSGRELQVSKLPDMAKTWINTHLVYTHGYGLVMSPVNEFTSDGMPSFVVQDIPPKSDTSISISRPEIYYGEQTGQFAVVNTTTQEFDYPKGDQNVYTTYRGTGGVPLSSWFRRLAFSLKLSDLNILISDYITDQSRLMLRRVIKNRDRTIAPFLTYDSDPYLVVDDNGHLYWIHEAYTTTNMLPYSQSLDGNRTGTNYIRNSVDVVVDAYNGDVSYYTIDPSDPLVQTYTKIFPTLFKNSEEMPASLKAHLRYPRDLFIKQAKIYATYHMTDPQVFYNREDLWNIPQQSYRGKNQSISPYYIIMNLPEAETNEFILMLPMTPSKKDNMIAWMCARCDGNHLGELLIYSLPKDKLVYGPQQIEARINQEPSITSEMTLWGQVGSNVIRGNLLVIPIANSFMYVEPIYLESKEGQMPQLKRVIAIQDGKLEMEKDLDAALRAIFPEGQVAEANQQELNNRTLGALPEMAQEALDHYEKAQKYLNEANWRKYGDELEEIQRILHNMSANEQ